MAKRQLAAAGHTKCRLTYRFAARRIRVADGHNHRMLDDRKQCAWEKDRNTSHAKADWQFTTITMRASSESGYTQHY